MRSYEWFVFFLCLFVFSTLVLFLGVLIYQIITLTRKLIASGFEDKKIIEEKTQERLRKKNLLLPILEKAISIIVLLCVAGGFAFSLSVRVLEDVTPNGMSTVQVVLSDSMAYKHEKNEYLNTNNLNDQFRKFDLIVIDELPDEFELELYDIVVYRYSKDLLVIHRIIGIEEPNASHPEHRHFLLKGDANDYNDKFPVKYDQMVGVYNGDKVENVGSFILFLQSPAGWVCVIFIIVMSFVIPYIENKIEEEKELRYRIIAMETTLKGEDISKWKL